MIPKQRLFIGTYSVVHKSGRLIGVHTRCKKKNNFNGHIDPFFLRWASSHWWESARFLRAHDVVPETFRRQICFDVVKEHVQLAHGFVHAFVLHLWENTGLALKKNYKKENRTHAICAIQQNSPDCTSYSVWWCQTASGRQSISAAWRRRKVCYLIRLQTPTSISPTWLPLLTIGMMHIIRGFFFL